MESVIKPKKLFCAGTGMFWMMALLFVSLPFLAAGQRVLQVETITPSFADSFDHRFPPSPAPSVANLGVNRHGTEPDADLEIFWGSEEYKGTYPELGYAFALGLWHLFDSRMIIEWAKNTETDEARTSTAIYDLTGDGIPELIGGTSSGWNLEVMDTGGNYIWSFPKQRLTNGNYAFVGSAAIDTVRVDERGPIPVILTGLNNTGHFMCFEGNPSGAGNGNDGITFDAVNSAFRFPGPNPGTDGVDWDVLWDFVPCDPPTFDSVGISCPFGIVSTPAVGDVDGDGKKEVVFGSDDGHLYIVRADSGKFEAVFTTVNSYPVQSSPAIADVDGDGKREIFFGANDNRAYCLRWNGSMLTTVWSIRTGGWVVSSPSVGDIDDDGRYECVFGVADSVSGNNVYCVDAITGNIQWIASTMGEVYSSPSFARRKCSGSIPAYDAPWPTFRHDYQRTGFMPGKNMGVMTVYIGSQPGILYAFNGASGARIDSFITDSASVLAYPTSSSKFYSREIASEPIVADVDGDHRYEIMVYSRSDRYGTTGKGTGIDLFVQVEDSTPNPQTPLSVSVVTLLQPCAPVGNNPGHSGSLRAIGSGGFPPYTYSWSWIPSQRAWGDTLNGIFAGMYHVTVTDLMGCEASAQYYLKGRIAPNPFPGGPFYACNTHIPCHGGLSPVVHGPFDTDDPRPPFTYLWLNGNTPVSNDTVLHNVPAGSYTLVITDAAGCAGVDTFTLTEPAPIMTNLPQATPGNGLLMPCPGDANGQIDLTVTGGADCLPYAYQWTGPQGVQFQGEDVTGAGPGTYSVNITDANGCGTTASVSLNAVSMNLTLQDTCKYILIGYQPPLPVTLQATAPGGNPPVQFVWTPGPLYGPAVSVNPAVTTAYQVTATDANGCTASAGMRVKVIDISCSGSKRKGSKQGKVMLCKPGSKPGKAPKTQCVKWDGVSKRLQEGWSLGDCQMAGDPCRSGFVHKTDSYFADGEDDAFAEDATPEINVYPNPSFGSSTLSIRVPEDVEARISLVSPEGARVTDIYQGWISADGPNLFRIDFNSLSPGIYLIRYSTAETLLTLRVVHMK